MHLSIATFAKEKIQNMKSNSTTKTISKWCFLLALFLFVSVNNFAQAEKYLGVWRASNGDNQVLKFYEWEELVEKWKELGEKGMRLQDLEAIKYGDDVRYIGTWVSGKGKYALYAFDNFKDFADKWKSMLDEKGLQLIDVEVVPMGDKNFYIGVWDTGKGGSALFQYNNWDDFVAKWKELAKDNRVLIDVEAFNNNGNTNYVGVWETGNGADQRLYAADSYEKFEAKWKEFNKEDLRLVDIDISAVKGGELFVGVWNKGTGGHYMWYLTNANDFSAKNKEMKAQNMVLMDVAMVQYGKSVSQPKPPAGKPINNDTLYFSKGQPMKKEAVTGIEFPADMPPIVYPNFEGCNSADRKEIEKAWAMAHHHAWRAFQLFKFLDKAGSNRDNFWSAGYTAGNDKEKRKLSYSPYAFFGEYDGGTYRYEFIRDAVFMNWNSRFQKKMTIKCRRNEDGAHPCYLKNPGTNRPPSANHIVNGTVNLCNRFFDDKDDRDQVRTVLHEMFHWLAPKGLAILDTQTHSDMKNGWCQTDTDKMYGLDDVMHLATSKGCWGNPKWHRGMAARNNDNYAYFILNFGEEIFYKGMKQFPK